jgi:ATP-GRASP peptide maturase of grasp-with-spasm system
MILILSSPYDHSTNEVIKWLNYYNANYIRINHLNELNSFTYSNSKIKKAKIFEIDIQNISSVWFRRTPEYLTENFRNKKLSEEINKILISEYHVIYSYIIGVLRDRFWLSHPSNSSLNKLTVLDLAKKCGLKIPETYIFNNKKDLADILKKHSVITKPIYEVARLQNGNKIDTTRTVEIKTCEDISDTFFISKFQKKIEKKYEIRSVFLLGKFYTMSIHSQENQKTQTDFRNYDFKFPNRFCPIKLPQHIEKSITNLMFELKLNFGSIDLIMSNNGDFYFLEINPVGQFGMTSTPNNYNIEKIIAQKLIHESHEFQKRKK